MIRSNSTNLNRIKGGEVIKQGDFSSTFEYELLDYKYSKITNLDGQDAKIKLANQKGKLVINATVENSKVNFKIGKILPAGIYQIEIEVSDYVFPSDRRTTLEVTQSADEYTSNELLDLVKNDVKTEIDKYIAEHPNGPQTEELPDLTTLYNLAKI